MALSDSEIVELHCLDMAEKVGRIPDGCDAGKYLETRLLERDGPGYSITPLGLARMAALRASDGERAGPASEKAG